MMMLMTTCTAFPEVRAEAACSCPRQSLRSVSLNQDSGESGETGLPEEELVSWLVL